MNIAPLQKRPLLSPALISFCFFFVLCVPAHAEEVLYIPFDGTVDAKGISGTVSPNSITGKVAFDTGKTGKAFISGPGPNYGLLQYPSANVVSPAQGTVAMWVKPVNWSSTDSAFHVFFQTMGTSSLTLYKYFEKGSFLMLASPNMVAGPYFSSITSSIKWNQGEWHHIAGTWSKSGVLLYMDGVPISSSPAFAVLPQSLGPNFTIGDAPWTTPRSSYSLIDEVRIYNQALPPSEIKNLFLGQAVTSSSPHPPQNLSVSGLAATEPTQSTDETPTGGSDTITASTAIKSITSTISLSNNTAAVDEKQAEFAQSALPTQMKVGSLNFLASPIVLVLQQNNQRIVLNSSANSVSQQTGSDTAVAQGRLSGSSVAIQTKTTMERDGLITIELSNAGGAPVPDDAELTLEIPLNANAFNYRIRWDSGVRDIVETLKTTSSIESTAFVPYYWLGNNDSGLFWFSDLSRNWPNATSSDAIRIDRTGSTLLFRQKLKGIKQPLPINWKYRLGLQLTPTKKINEAARRRLRLVPGVNANAEIIWPVPKQNSLKYFGYPEAADSKEYLSMINGIKKLNRAAIPYLTPTFISVGAPEWEANQSQWMSGKFDSQAEVMAMGGTLAGVTPTSASWHSFITKKTVDFRHAYQVDGLYFDNAFAYELYNPTMNLGYTAANGVPQKEVPIFEYRELYKRLIESLKTENPNTQIITHASGHFALPLVSLADSYLDGEQYRGIVKDNYLDVLGLDQLRAEFMGRQWGLAPIFLPEFDDTNKARIEPTRGLMALLMLHDINIWPIWCNLNEANRALTALDRYGYVNTQFVPYFSNAPAASSSSPSMLVSSYRKTSTDQLLVIANVIKSPVQSKICLSESTTKSFYKWPDLTPIASGDGRCIDVTVNPQDYLLVQAKI